MSVNTRYLFLSLLRSLRVDVVCDVGSMNGADALAFSARVPESRVYAFEANPHNFALMQADAALRTRNLELLPLAASNHDGDAEFFLVPADYQQVNDVRGMSSLYSRSGPLASAEVVRVSTTRLDSFLRGRHSDAARVALWIDAEGAAFEVIEGASAVAEQVQLLHVEVETTPCIAAGQKLYPEVKALLTRLGFVELGTDRLPSRPQFNAVFVRATLPVATRLRIHLNLLKAHLRRAAARSVAAACPAGLRRRLTGHRRSRSAH